MKTTLTLLFLVFLAIGLGFTVSITFENWDKLLTPKQKFEQNLPGLIFYVLALLCSAIIKKK